MTPHEHSTFVPGCYRCELGRDEARDALLDEIAEELYAAGPWGKPFQFINDGAHLVTDAHALAVYREMADLVLRVAQTPAMTGGET